MSVFDTYVLGCLGMRERARNTSLDFAGPSGCARLRASALLPVRPRSVHLSDLTETAHLGAKPLGLLHVADMPGLRDENQFGTWG
jgi:hypothetical protein